MKDLRLYKFKRTKNAKNLLCSKQMYVIKGIEKADKYKGQHQEDKSINYIKMSNIGSISNSGNKFNVVASTLSTEQLESFGKSGNLMPNTIIVQIGRAHV